MKEYMGSFIHILEGHHEDEIVAEDYAYAIGLCKKQINEYLIDKELQRDENGIKLYWKSDIDTLFETDFIQDELELMPEVRPEKDSSHNWHKRAA